MRGATLFFSAPLVVVGTDRYVDLKRNLSKVLSVEEDLATGYTAARKRPQCANISGLVSQRNLCNNV